MSCGYVSSESVYFCETPARSWTKVFIPRSWAALRAGLIAANLPLNR